MGLTWETYWKKRVRIISRETGRYATNIALPVNLIVKLITKLDKNTKEYKRYLPVPWCCRCSCSFFPQSHEHMHGGYGVIYSTLWFNVVSMLVIYKDLYIYTHNGVNVFQLVKEPILGYMFLINCYQSLLCRKSPLNKKTMCKSIPERDKIKVNCQTPPCNGPTKLVMLGHGPSNLLGKHTICSQKHCKDVVFEGSMVEHLTFKKIKLA